MNNYIAAIINMLNAIHYENLILFSALTGEGENRESIKRLQEKFEEAYEGIVKK